MSLLAALLGALAWWGWRDAGGLTRLVVPRAREPLRRIPWSVASGTGAGILAGLVSGAAVGIATALLVATVVGLGRQMRAQRRAALARREVAMAAAALAGMLRLGLLPTRALEVVAHDSAVLSEAAAAQSVGASVAATLRRGADRPGREALAELAVAWEVVDRTGASLSHTLAVLAERVAAEAEQRRTVEAELAAPRSTGRLLALLPLAGLGIGYGLGGDPLGWLTGSLIGEVCLVVGIGLGCAGLLWTEWIARTHGQ